MPPPTKSATTTTEKDRRKSATTKMSLVTLKVSPERLRNLLDPAATPAKEESPPKDSPAKESPATSTTLPIENVSAPVNGETAPSSSPGTPAATSTPSQVPMGPPTEGPKKKGVKRGASGVNGAEPKARGKPGPKKKPRLEDGTIDPNAKNNAGTYHKLGPKANQGAINAGLRALDRSGKPCRKWAKGGFRLKTFTGVVWEIPRWTAPQKPSPDATQEVSTTSTDSSNKENKEDSQMKSENSASGADAEQRSLPASLPAASSPAPTPVAAAS